jgi:hypothetical protein
MRTLRCFGLVLLACAAVLAQDGNTGLSPKAGAVSDNLYTNLYFGMNLRFPQDWDLMWAASEGTCAKECMLLDVRAPGYPKVQRGLMITAEAATGSGDGRLARAGMTLEQAGAKRLLPVPSEIHAGGKTFYRTDYKSELMKGDLLQAIIVLPGPKYALVFSFSADSRKELESLVDQFPKQITFTGATQ